MKNPYFDEIKKLKEKYGTSFNEDDGFLPSMENFTTVFPKRKKLVKKYSWAIPDDAAIYTILKHSDSLVEIGAGNGYWAYLLKQKGGIVHCYDQYPSIKTWHPVKYGTELNVLDHLNSTLFLCWAPYNDSTATNTLKLYNGDKLVVIGESGGCTADDEFFEILEKDWEEIEFYTIPTWCGIRDNLSIYKRKNKNRFNPQTISFKFTAELGALVRGNFKEELKTIAFKTNTKLEMDETTRLLDSVLRIKITGKVKEVKLAHQGLRNLIEYPFRRKI